jgi:hypothetical protein
MPKTVSSDDVLQYRSDCSCGMRYRSMCMDSEKPSAPTVAAMAKVNESSMDAFNPRA